MFKYYILFQEDEDTYYLKDTNKDNDIGYTLHAYKATRFMDKKYAYEFKDKLQLKTNRIYKVCKVVSTISIL
jgi:hypothetical protein